MSISKKLNYSRSRGGEWEKWGLNIPPLLPHGSLPTLDVWSIVFKSLQKRVQKRFKIQESNVHRDSHIFREPDGRPWSAVDFEIRQTWVWISALPAIKWDHGLPAQHLHVSVSSSVKRKHWNLPQTTFERIQYNSAFVWKALLLLAPYSLSCFLSDI